MRERYYLCRLFRDSSIVVGIYDGSNWQIKGQFNKGNQHWSIFTLIDYWSFTISLTYSKSMEKWELLWSKVIEHIRKDYFRHYIRQERLLF